MKAYKKLSEMALKAPQDTYHYICSIIMNAEKFGDGFDPEDFESYFGGFMYLIEDYDELDLIKTSRLRSPDDDEWLSILEEPDSFDDCRWIADGRYVVIFMATNNAGGNTYFVPKEIADKCPNVTKSIELTHEAWGLGDEAESNSG